MIVISFMTILSTILISALSGSFVLDSKVYVEKNKLILKREPSTNKLFFFKSALTTELGIQMEMAYFSVSVFLILSVNSVK